MWIKNKRQGTTWEITDEAHAKRLLKKKDEYEEAKGPQSKPKEPEKSG